MILAKGETREYLLFITDYDVSHPLTLEFYELEFRVEGTSIILFY